MSARRYMSDWKAGYIQGGGTETANPPPDPPPSSGSSGIDITISLGPIVISGGVTSSGGSIGLHL